MPNPSKRRRRSETLEQVVQAVHEELKRQLNAIWRAQSSITKEAIVEELHRNLRTIVEPCKTNEPICKDVSYVLFKSISVILLTDAAVKVPANVDKERQQYLETLQALALLLYRMYSAFEFLPEEQQNESVELFERHMVVKVFQTFAVGLSAPSWGVRYRIIQFFSFFLEHCDKDNLLFECVSGSGDPTDIVRRQIIERSYDTKDRVAALAMECIGHYQEDETRPKKSKAFSVLLFKMQEHESELVRYAATKAITVCKKSAPAILRRVLDVHPSVRVLAYEIIAEAIAPKILHPQLRSYLLLVGFNDANALVRAAALKCLDKWITEYHTNYEELISGKDVGEDHAMFARVQLNIQKVFDADQACPLKENLATARRQPLPRRSRSRSHSTLREDNTSVAASPAPSASVVDEPSAVE